MASKKAAAAATVGGDGDIAETVRALLGQDDRFPALLCFDIDKTLLGHQGTYIDCLRPPFRLDKTRHFAAVDASGTPIRFFPDCVPIIQAMREVSPSTQLAVASRTDTPDWASEILELLGVAGWFHVHEIYPGQKLAHVKSINKKTGIALKDMVFYDDEYRNVRDVSSIGVTCIHTPRGLHIDEFVQGIEEWRLKNSATSTKTEDKTAGPPEPSGSK